MPRSMQGIAASIRSEFGRGVASNKNEGRRNMMGLYETLFEPYRESAKRVLEMGVYMGGSIRIWREYFPNAVIYGADKGDKALKSIRGLTRVVPFSLDQGNKTQLKTLAGEGPFDISIDDCCHNWANQITAFETLWPEIKPGGLYIIEHVVTSYRRHIDRVRVPGSKTLTYQPYDENSKISCVEYFKNLVDHINFDGDDWNKVKHSEFQRTVDTITFRTNCIVIKKRLTDDDQGAL